ncbi:MAG: tRNA preQ1(34) S-adenosylmethionine ribosyltransferase-isomerase QueA [Firmicutes bacterium]|nr:tRNA preQ1(34) S-adenosylmethionine ribosyltransferase-isomerase QueA [Bacillota bacterium]
MNIEDYNYNLPEELIAQTPIKNRSESRLLVMDRKTGEIEDKIFKNIKDELNKGDVLVLNDTKVLPARIFGNKIDTNAHIEVLLLKNIEKDVWECLSRPFKRLNVGTKVKFGDKLIGEVIQKKEEGIILINFSYEGIFIEIIEELGLMPLPPYIHESLEDQTRYQTVYAKYLGSAAAPTAGLHFTHELLEELEKKGVEILYVTLHVGLGTFRPVQETDITKHVMHTEHYKMTKDVADKLNKAKAEGRNIYAVGTTSTRTLESIMCKYNKFVECEEDTSIYIYPGYEFKAIDGLITNFHLPKSTLLMLVSAFSTRDYILNAYAHAIESKYRFFSFGDAMLIK